MSLRGFARSIKNHIRFFIRESKFLRRLEYLKRYPGLEIESSVEISNEGQFIFGAGTCINKGSRLFISPDGKMEIGEKCYIGRDVQLATEYSGHLRIHDEVTLQDRAIVIGDVRIKTYTQIAAGLFVSAGHHHYTLIPHLLCKDQDTLANSHIGTSEEIEFKPVVIEEDCVIGINVSVMYGITIGRGCVIGSNSVITKDLPPYSIVLGSPARVMGQRLKFEPPSQIDFQTEEQLPYFYSGFRMRADDRKLSKQNGGLIAGNEFTVALKSTEESKKIHLVLKSLVGNCFVLFDGQKVQISEAFKEYSFSLGQVTGFYTFTVEGDFSNPNQAVFVERVWIS